MTEHMALCLHVAEKHNILLAEKQEVSVLLTKALFYVVVDIIVYFLYAKYSRQVLEY